MFWMGSKQGTLFRITPVISGITISLAGAFLILYGLNMLGIFSVLRKIRTKQPEWMITYALKKREQSRSPFLIGFFRFPAWVRPIAGDVSAGRSRWLCFGRGKNAHPLREMSNLSVTARGTNGCC